MTLHKVAFWFIFWPTIINFTILHADSTQSGTVTDFKLIAVGGVVGVAVAATIVLGIISLFMDPNCFSHVLSYCIYF